MKPCSISFSAMYTFMVMPAIQMVEMSFRKKSTPKKSCPALLRRLWCFMHRSDNFFAKSNLFKRPFWPFLWVAWPWKCTSLKRKLNKLSFSYFVTTFFCFGFVWTRTILTIFMTLMAMKANIVLKEIEQGFIWLHFHCYISSSMRDIFVWG